MIDLIVNDRLLIPKEVMPKKAIEKRYDITIFNERMCGKCSNFDERPNELCASCDGFIADYRLWKETKTHWSVPQGDLLNIRKLLAKKGIDYSILDSRPEIPFENGIVWTGKLFGKNYIDENGNPRANQKKVVKEWLKYEDGVLKAPPRSGKTPMAVYLMCKLRAKCVIFAHQHELLKQFYNTIMEMTNTKLLEKSGKKVVLWVKTLAQLKLVDEYDIVLINYQKLMHDLERTDYFNGKFSLLIIDECHNSGAVTYLRIVSKMNIRHRMGLSATPKRKDGRHTLISRMLGPVTAEADSISLVPKIEFFVSKAVPSRNYKIWHHAKKWLETSTVRNSEIIKQTFIDLRAGHEVIIIPVDSLSQQKLLVDAINKTAKKYVDTKDEDWPKNLALAFNGQGGTKSELRKEILEQVDKPGPTVLVAIRKLIREGVNMFRPSMMYITVPMSASNVDGIGAPMFYQMVMRICTPANKPEPVVRIWVDNVGMFKSCLKGLFFHEIWNNRFKGNIEDKTATGRYRVDPSLLEYVKHMDNKSKTPNKLRDTRGWV